MTAALLRRRRRRLPAWMRWPVAPLVLAGFFQPWAYGAGPLSGTSFSGYSLVGITGRLALLGLSPAQTVVVAATRFAILGVAVAACWQLLLAPWHRRHPAYMVSGWYLVAGAVVALTTGLVRSGLVLPAPGLSLWAGGALLFSLGELPDRPVVPAGGEDT